MPLRSLRQLFILEGYQVQKEVHKLIMPKKGDVVGFKIGCTTKIMQNFLNINVPCAGGVFSSEIFNNHSCLRLSDFTRVGVECELVIQLGKDFISSIKKIDSKTPEMELNIRIGIHTGSIVAGVIGNESIQYDFLGETVNTAFSICDLTEPNEILISNNAWMQSRNSVKVSSAGLNRLKGMTDYEIFKVRN